MTFDPSLKKLKTKRNWKLNFIKGELESLIPKASKSSIEYDAAKYLCTNYFVYEEYPQLPLSINFLMLVAFQKTKYYEIYEKERQTVIRENGNLGEESKTPEISSCIDDLMECQYVEDSDHMQTLFKDYMVRVFDGDYMLLSVLM
jgi:hypothetical protein